MLSGETAAGKYPLESVQTMRNIAVRTEEALSYRELLREAGRGSEVTVTNAISQSVAYTALDLNATAVITATESGHTARMVSKYRPKAPIVAVTPHADVLRKLMLVWGVYPILAKEADHHGRNAGYQCGKGTGNRIGTIRRSRCHIRRCSG